MRRIIIIEICLCVFVGMQAQNQSGLILSGGRGNITTNVASGSYLDQLEKQGGAYVVNYDFNAAIGYKFRIFSKEKKYFYDLGINAGVKSFTYKASSSGDTESIFDIMREGNYQYYHASLESSFNYIIIRKLHAGLGIEPTYYFYEDYTNKNHFDIPVIGRVAYDFRFMELGFTYKYGLCNVLKSDNFESGRFNDWQISLFIPF